MNDAARLARCRDMLAGISPGQWTRVHDGDEADGGCFVEARGEMGELVAVARFTRAASEAEIEFMTQAPETVRFLLELVDRAIDFASRASSHPSDAGPPAGRAIGPDAPLPTGVAGLPPAADERHSAEGEASTDARRSSAAREPGQKNYSAECAMKCAEPAFKRFLMDRHGLESPATDERAARKTRSLLGVASRRELNEGGKAAQAWKALRGDFEAWRRTGT